MASKSRAATFSGTSTTSVRREASAANSTASFEADTFFETSGASTEAMTERDTNTFGDQTGAAAAAATAPVASGTRKKNRKDGHKVPRLLEMRGISTMSHIADRFDTYAAVTSAMRDAGLDRCSLIFGIDYTSSNNFQVCC